MGIVRLPQPFAGVTPLALVDKAPRPRTRGTIVGFGEDGLGHIAIKEMGTVRLKRCPNAIRSVGIVRGQLSTSICWHPKRHGNDTCSGDSGGPLLVDNAVAGVTVGGYGRTASCPGILSWDTSVARVRDWIDSASSAP